MFITEAKLRDIIKQVLVDAQLITVGTYPKYSGKSYEELDHDINSILFSTPKPTVAKAEDMDDGCIGLKAENHRLRKELEEAEKLLAHKTEVIYNMEVDQDVQDEKLSELEGLLTRAQVVLEGLTSGDYFD